ncbi:MAG: hypothetical protein Q9220_001304 [cf. Caloplaca sp. 1 TL-2023]
MEPPRKRRRKAARDSDAELDEQRARCDRKLKSTFESIFAKYEKDFDGIGDEIDLVTGKIVVNNGHVENMHNEMDPGEDTISGDDEDVISINDEIEEGAIRIIPDSQDFDTSDEDDPLGMLEDVITSTASRLKQGNALRLSQNRNEAFNGNRTGMGTAVSSSRWHRESRAVEEAWRVPPLPTDFEKKPALPSPSPSDTDNSDSSKSASLPGASIWALPKHRRRRQDRSSEANLLRQEKNFTASPRSSGKVQIWTENEKNLLRQLRTSTDKTFVELQSSFPNRSASALNQQWYKQSHESTEIPGSDGKNSTDLAGVPILKVTESRMETDRDTISNHTLPLEAMHVPASPLDLENSETLQIGVIHSPTASGSTPINAGEHPATENRLASGTVVPDSQSDVGTQSQRVELAEPWRQPSELAHHHASSRDEEACAGRSKGSGNTRVAAVVLPVSSTSHDPRGRNEMLQAPVISQRGNRRRKAPITHLKSIVQHVPSPKQLSSPNESRAYEIPESQDIDQGMEAGQYPQLGSNSTNLAGDHNAGGTTSQLDNISLPRDDVAVAAELSRQDDRLHEMSECREGCSVEPILLDSHDHSQSYHQHKEQHLDAAAPPKDISNLALDANDVMARSNTQKLPELYSSKNTPVDKSSVSGVQEGLSTLHAMDLQQAETPIPQSCNTQNSPVLPAGISNDNSTLHRGYLFPPPKTPPTELSAQPAGHDRSSVRVVRSQIHLSPPSPTLLQTQSTQQATKQPKTTQTAAKIVAGRSKDQMSSQKGTWSTTEIKTEPHKVVESDDDELEYFIKPVLATKFCRTRRQTDHGSTFRLAFRPRIENHDMSDDELYTPPQVRGGGVEMTPVRSSMASKRRVSSLI